MPSVSITTILILAEIIITSTIYGVYFGTGTSFSDFFNQAREAPKNSFGEGVLMTSAIMSPLFLIASIADRLERKSLIVALYSLVMGTMFAVAGVLAIISWASLYHPQIFGERREGGFALGALCILQSIVSISNLVASLFVYIKNHRDSDHFEPK